jgi:ABC-type lipoprotein release transport system permease subunit
MIWSVAWKNIWRNKVRSLVVICAVTLGIFGGVMLVGIMEGWIAQRIYDVIHNEISHVQIHNPEFMNNEEMQYTIADYPKVIDSLNTIPDIIAYSPRVKIFAMAQSDWAASGLIIEGINPDDEKRVSKVPQNLIEGDFFTEDSRMPSIIIGSKAAENLKLLNYQITEEKIQSLETATFGEDFKDRLNQLSTQRYRTEKDFKKALAEVLSEKELNMYTDMLIHHFSFYRLRSKITITTQNIKGNIVYLTFRLKGIYKTNNTMFDGTIAYISADAVKKEIDFEVNDFHEIGIICKDEETGVKVAAKIKEMLPGYDVMSWKELSPEIAYYSDFMKIMDYIYVSIFLLALAFGIINTMLMSVLERVKELGMLMAIGMNKKRVFSMIMLESVFLTLTGGVIGMVLSGITVAVLGNTGINFSMWAEGFEAIGYASIVYPKVPFDIFIGISILVIITGILSSIWPARKALSLNPCEAIRTD